MQQRCIWKEQETDAVMLDERCSIDATMYGNNNYNQPPPQQGYGQPPPYACFYCQIAEV